MKYKFLFIVIAFILITFITTGCEDRDNEYSEFTKSFNESILKVAKSIDSNDTMISLERINLDENTKEIENMKILLENIEGNVPPKMEAHYKEMKSLYDMFLFLQETAAKEDKLSYEEISEINGDLVIIALKKNDLEKNK